MSQTKAPTSRSAKEADKNENPPPSKSPSSLQELRRLYSEGEQQAGQLVEDVAKSKLTQDSLKKTIDVIDKYLAEFAKDGGGDGAWKHHKELRKEVEERIQVLGEKLGPEVVAGIEDAIEKKVIGNQATLAEAADGFEAEIAGANDVAAREAKRQVSVTKAQFDALALQALKTRNKEVSELLIAANKIDDDISSKDADPAKDKHIYAILWLANDRLHSTRPNVDTEVAAVPFQFPQNKAEHEKLLVAAYNAYLESLTAAQEANETFKKSQSGYAATLKELKATFPTFEADVVAKAVESKPCPVEPQSQARG